MNRRIALVVGTSTGGVGRHVRSLAEGLRGRGHRVAVLGPASADRAFGFTGAGIRFVPVPIGAAPSLGDPGVVLRLGALVSGADVVHAHGVRAGALCALGGGVAVGGDGAQRAAVGHGAVVVGLSRAGADRGSAGGGGPGCFG